MYRPDEIVVNKAAKIGLLLDLRRLEVLEQLLLVKDLPIPLRLGTALGLAEAKVTLAYGSVPLTARVAGEPLIGQQSDHQEGAASSPGGGHMHSNETFIHKDTPTGPVTPHVLQGCRRRSGQSCRTRRAAEALGNVGSKKPKRLRRPWGP